MANSVSRTTARPLPVPRTRRNHGIAVMSSFPAGKCAPVVAIPLLREDSLNARIAVSCEMMETAELIANPVTLRVTAYCVPYLAFSRFDGSRDQMDRSYMGQPKIDGGTTVPFFEMQAWPGTVSDVHKTLGLHGKTGDMLNTAYLEAYNLIWNFRAKNRSPDIPMRTRLDGTLAGAFWQHSRFKHIVPDFDQAVIDGEVALNITDGTVALRNTSLAPAGYDAKSGHVDFFRGHTPTTHNLKLNNTTTNVIVAADSNPGAATSFNAFVDLNTIIGELAADGITVSLANIDVARKTQAFARLRNLYTGFEDDYIIDMLMSGLSIPDQDLKQPFLLADQTVRFGQAKRYATDSANLAESAVSGGATMNISLRMPKVDVGGVVMVIAEAIPEQLFERQRDPLLFAANTLVLPEYLRDTLDPEKVDVITNGMVDTSHATPSATFGYAPLHWQWTTFPPRVGGKFYRPSVDAPTDTTRQRIWAVEVANPTLSKDFYVVSTMHQKPFLDTTGHPFEFAAVGNAAIDGHTVFGGVLVEASDNYEKVAAKAPMDRIDKPASLMASQPSAPAKPVQQLGASQRRISAPTAPVSSTEGSTK